MNKFDQIGKLANAAMMVQEVALHYTISDELAERLQQIAEELANIGDEIEES